MECGLWVRCFARYRPPNAITLLWPFLFISWWGKWKKKTKVSKNHLFLSVASRLLSPQLGSYIIRKSDPSQPGSSLSVVVNACACFRVTFKSLLRANRLPGLCRSSWHTAAGPVSQACWLLAGGPALARPVHRPALQNQKSSAPPRLSFLIFKLLISVQITCYSNLHQQVDDDHSGRLE